MPPHNEGSLAGGRGEFLGFFSIFQESSSWYPTTSGDSYEIADGKQIVEGEKCYLLFLISDPGGASYHLI